MDISQKSLEKHYEWKGKIEVISRASIKDKEDLSICYTPGVAEPCMAIAEDGNKVYDLTRRSNLVAVVTDGTAVLGLGDIGPEAAMPVMEGKCALFKSFADVDAFPICVDSKDPSEIVDAVALISKSFGGINLEDISAPRCFQIERELKRRCDVPVFHDDQHGTAIVTVAALINAAKVIEKEPSDMTIVVNGAGAAGISIAKLLVRMGFGNVMMCDTRGIIYRGAPWLNPFKREIAEMTNLEERRGTLAQGMKGADVFIGVSKPGIVTKEMVSSMAGKAIVFPMANPVPEIMPELALEAGAFVVGTGRSDFPNQINNVLAFPGVFKGALAVRAKDITEEMKVAAAYGISSVLDPQELAPDRILPDPFDPRVVPAVSKAVMEASII
ncbi:MULTISPECIES: NAD(P)-dependent malic enzyme [Dethiosulfovibrio]|uniref:NADP-dependent malic enzyme n=2 Tax=Dethiosulfovibrio TaxID=47054 RepID=A0ABS9EPU6_9BACT|nr:MULTISPECIES: NADP-dependent malic enzyme [Dethiosulfovibrio]MCF4113227.1 NADP-dependent malic enzyme [Dethiosulfovibrio russensis]MCF4142291.1 NADP-dependent malic enzyme [Dethiosulfovibrio marinus]MCF4144599.1 NADP-dependent malic enzyme [Dethiosulfovibrio acidaminovorans]